MPQPLSVAPSPAALSRPVVPPRFGLVPAPPKIGGEPVEPKPLPQPQQPLARAGRSELAAPTHKVSGNQPTPNQQVASSGHRSGKVALLSFFDGIGSAHQSLLDLQIRPVVSWSWELDEDCHKVVRARHPEVIQQGDAMSAGPDEGSDGAEGAVPRVHVRLGRMRTTVPRLFADQGRRSERYSRLGGPKVRSMDSSVVETIQECMQAQVRADP